MHYWAMRHELVLFDKPRNPALVPAQISPAGRQDLLLPTILPAAHPPRAFRYHGPGCRIQDEARFTGRGTAAHVFLRGL